MQSEYNTELHHKILYKEPLFIADIKLRPKVITGGYHKNNDQLGRLLNRDNKLRFMFAVHAWFENASVVLRQIIKNNTFAVELQLKSIDNIVFLSDEKLTGVDLQTLDYNDDTRAFLDLWQQFLKRNGIDIYLRNSTELLELGFKIIEKRDDIEYNPLFCKRLKHA